MAIIAESFSSVKWLDIKFVIKARVDLKNRESRRGGMTDLRKCNADRRSNKRDFPTEHRKQITVVDHKFACRVNSDKQDNRMIDFGLRLPGCDPSLRVRMTARL